MMMNGSLTPNDKKHTFLARSKQDMVIQAYMNRKLLMQDTKRFSKDLCNTTIKSIAKHHHFLATMINKSDVASSSTHCI